MGLLDSIARAFGRQERSAPVAKPGRNDVCWCGSGKKYKKCHLPADEAEAARKASCAQNCGAT